MARQKWLWRSKLKMTEETICKDFACPKHGNISLRGRSFRGTVIKKFPKRIVIEFERTIYIKKYERYSKRKTKLHARLPDCISKDINVGDYVDEGDQFGNSGNTGFSGAPHLHWEHYRPFEGVDPVEAFIYGTRESIEARFDDKTMEEFWKIMKKQIEEASR